MAASLCQAFGAHPRIGAFLLDGDAVLHVVGRRVVLYRLRAKAMSFVYTPPREVLELTARDAPAGAPLAVYLFSNGGAMARPHCRDRDSAATAKFRA